MSIALASILQPFQFSSTYLFRGAGYYFEADFSI
jgi:hypothetical protein